MGGQNKPLSIPFVKIGRAIGCHAQAALMTLLM